MDITTDSKQNHQTQPDMPTKGKKKILWIGTGCLILFIVACVLSLVVTKFKISTGSISITDIFLTTGLDAQGHPLPATTRFSPDQSRIYCIVTVKSPKPVNVGIRWYYENELIYEKSDQFNGSWVFFIQPLPGQLFKEGNYRVEVYLVKEAVRTVYFSVEK